jgi:DNA polymerase-3 subunit epsilon
MFKDHAGRVLYVGKAVDLRRRVRSYFTGDERRKIGQLLRETETIDHIVCAGDLEASVLEVRLIHELLPRFNRQSKGWRRYAYLKVTLNERFPRLSVVRATKDDGGYYLGPLPSASVARAVAEAIETASPIRRCTKAPGKTPRPAACAPAQLGVAACPCAGTCSEEDYRAVIAGVMRGLTDEPGLLLDPLARRMRALAEAGRYEEAADLRDRAAALSRAITRQRRLDSLRMAGRLTVEVDGEGGAVLDGGRLVAAWRGEGPMSPPLPVPPPPPGPLPRHLADELACVAGWLEARAARIRVVDCAGGLAAPITRLPRFEPSR